MILEVFVLIAKNNDERSALEILKFTKNCKIRESFTTFFFFKMSKKKQIVQKILKKINYKFPRGERQNPRPKFGFRQRRLGFGHRRTFFQLVFNNFFSIARNYFSIILLNCFETFWWDRDRGAFRNFNFGFAWFLDLPHGNFFKKLKNNFVCVQILIFMRQKKQKSNI